MQSDCGRGDGASSPSQRRRHMLPKQETREFVWSAHLALQPQRLAGAGAKAIIDYAPV
jgi:hypothetical protein